MSPASGWFTIVPNRVTTMPTASSVKLERIRLLTPLVRQMEGNKMVSEPGGCQPNETANVGGDVRDE